MQCPLRSGKGNRRYKKTNKIQACLGDTHGTSLNLAETNEHLLSHYLMLEGTREERMDNSDRDSLGAFWQK